MAIKRALSDKDYERVIKLTFEGEHHDKSLAGLEQKWKEYRHEAYRLSGQLENQRSLAMEFVLDDQFDYYQKLKSTYAEQDWILVYPDIINALERQKDHSRAYPKILIEEHELTAAQAANNRRDYQGVCSLIRSLIKDGGTVQASQVIAQLLTTYPRKPAFREELRKITIPETGYLPHQRQQI